MRRGYGLWKERKNRKRREKKIYGGQDQGKVKEKVRRRGKSMGFVRTERIGKEGKRTN